MKSSPTETTKSPPTPIGRNLILSNVHKSYYNSLEEDHSRNSSVDSVKSERACENARRSEVLVTKKGAGIPLSPRYLMPTSKPPSKFAQSSPNSPNKDHCRRRSNFHLADMLSSKSTATSLKNSPSTKRSLFASIKSPYKAVSMDEQHLSNPSKIGKNDSTGSSSSELSSQSNLLQLPSTSSYQVMMFLFSKRSP